MASRKEPTAAQPIPLDALPLSELAQWLTDNMLPDARTFLLPGTVSAALGSGSGWVTPALSTGWTTAAAPVQYMKDALGFLHFRGSASCSTANAYKEVFQLPAGFRPGVTDYYAALSNSNTIAAVYIDTAGNVEGDVPGANYTVHFGDIPSILAVN